MKRSPNPRLIKIVWPLLLLAAAVAFPLVVPDLALARVAVFTLIFASLATSWNIFSGYTGYNALGHTTYFGFGAYAMSLITVNQHLPGGFSLFLLVPVGGLIAALCAIPLGWIALRTRGHAFVVITLITVFIFQLLAFNLRGITLGSAGIFLPGDGFDPDWYLLPYYYIQLAILVLALLVSWYIRSSRYGLWLLAIRDDEDRAEGLGVRTGASKLTAFVISAFFIGMIGAMYAYFVGSIYPPYAFDPALSITIVLMAFLGGIGTLAGPVVGALILEPAQQYFSLQAPTGYYQIFLGALFLVIMLLLPQGIVRSLYRLWAAWRARSGAGGSPVAPERQPVVVEKG
ncbi:MAG TPA: branched-chain amino acid ABC transporter permease [Ktedonobacterales bacterium]